MATIETPEDLPVHRSTEHGAGFALVEGQPKQGAAGLHAHVDAARALLAQDGAVGRKLDFLMQEFNREANTLCAKAQNTALTQIGLALKAVIDQMREQVQNVE